MTTQTAAQLYGELIERFQRVDFDHFRSALIENKDVDDVNRELGALGEYLNRVIDPEMESDFRDFALLAPDQLELRRGRQGFADLWRTFIEPWSDFQIRDSRTLELDPEHAISWATWHLRGQESGIELDIVQAALWTSREDRLVRLQAFASVEEARASAREQGLPVPDEPLSAMRFEKWTALGNDYLIVERADLPWELTKERIKRLCDPHFGIGSDGVLLLSPVDDDRHVAELRIFNPDGSEAELSGNGARQAVLYLRRRGWTDQDRFTIITKAGEVAPTIIGPDTVAVDIGRASLTSPDYPSGPPDGTGTLRAGGREWRFRHVNVGNPQCVIEVGDEVEDLDISTIGREIERHELFPNRTNVSFIQVEGSRVRARIFERGVGETLSSGTGASGAAVAAHLGGAASPITVRLDGGELIVEVSDDLDVRLTGTAEPVYAGELSTELARALRDG